MQINAENRSNVEFHRRPEVHTRILRQLDGAIPPGGLTTADLSARLPLVHRNQIYVGIRQLAADGLIQVANLRRNMDSRLSLHYTLTTSGRIALNPEYSPSAEELKTNVLDLESREAPPHGAFVEKNVPATPLEAKQHLRALLDDLAREVVYFFSISAVTSELCPSIDQARALIKNVPKLSLLRETSEERNTPPRSFSLFDFDDLIGEFTTSLVQISDLGDGYKLAEKLAAHLHRLPELLNSGIKEITDLTLNDWKDRPGIGGGDFRPNDRHRSTPLLHYCLFPVIGISSGEVSKFANHIGLVPSAGDIPPQIVKDLGTVPLVAHLIGRTVRAHWTAIARGESFDLRLPKGVPTIDPASFQEVCSICQFLCGEHAVYNVLRQKRVPLVFFFRENNRCPTISISLGGQSVKRSRYRSPMLRGFDERSL